MTGEGWFGKRVSFSLSAGYAMWYNKRSVFGGRKYIPWGGGGAPFTTGTCTSNIPSFSLRGSHYYSNDLALRKKANSTHFDTYSGSEDFYNPFERRRPFTNKSGGGRLNLKEQGKAPVSFLYGLLRRWIVNSDEHVLEESVPHARSWIFLFAVQSFIFYITENEKHCSERNICTILHVQV